MLPASLLHTDDERRQLLRADDTLHGIDYLEVDTVPGPTNQRLLRVYFIPKHDEGVGLDELLDELDGATNRFRIAGGSRVVDIRVTEVARIVSHLELRVSEPGDFSTYALEIDHVPAIDVPGAQRLDPAFSRVEFNFKVDCSTRFDCRPRRLEPVVEGVSPQIDYMAKDYASFRRGLIDLLPTLMPEWRERHAADLGMTIVELYAYVGDQLSYFQDAVANEAFLKTARQRVSVRRHARLIDYDIDDGTSSRTFVFLAVSSGSSGILPVGSALLSEIAVPLGSVRPPHPVVIPDVLGEAAIAAADTCFETVEEARLDSRLNRIPLHTWGNLECHLPRGATSADLTGRFDELLAPGDALLLEEERGPTGDLEDADPTHRQVVRIIDVERLFDPLLAKDVTRVRWHDADALAFSLPVAMREGDVHLTEVSVARGNLVLADHGTRVQEIHPRRPTGERERAYRFLLGLGPLGFSRPRPRPEESVSAVMGPSGERREPRVVLTVTTDDDGPVDWSPRRHLLDSEPFDAHFTVETDNVGRGWLRFGDGVFGMALPEDAEVISSYTVGLGPSGNIGQDALLHVVRPFGALASWPDVGTVRNPVPAWGGSEPETLEHVRRVAPPTFHATTFRAVTEDDYARVAELHPGVSRAVAQFRWTGSWHTVFLTIDPRGSAGITAELERSVKNWVGGFAQIGYDLEIDPPVFVPLEIELEICVRADYFRADVEQAALRVLSSQALPDGTGFFHPDQFTFGQPLYLSRLYAAAEAVPGVDSVTIERVTRRYVADPEPHRPATRKHLATGRVDVGRLEVIRVDSDLNFPENGSVRLEMRGGK